MASFKETPQPRTFAPSKEDVLQNLQYFFGAPVSPEKLKDYSEHHAMTYHFPDAYAGNNVSIALKPTTQLPHCCVQMLTLSPRATHRPRFVTRSTTSSSSRPRTGRPRCAQRHTHLKNLDVKQCALTTHHCSPGPVCRSACPSSRSRALSWSGTSAPRPIAAPLPPTHDRCVARPLTLAPNARGAQGSLRRPSYAARAVRGRVAYADFAPQEAPRSRRASVRTRSKRHPVQPTVARHNTRALTTNLPVAQWSGSDHRVGVSDAHPTLRPTLSPTFTCTCLLDARSAHSFYATDAGRQHFAGTQRPTTTQLKS